MIAEVINDMKNLYIKPEIVITSFMSEDIITASGVKISNESQNDFTNRTITYSQL